MSLTARITALAQAVGADIKTTLAHIGSRGPAHGVATTSEAGFLSASDKTKLDSMSEGASGDANAAVAIHVAATDPHTAYYNATRLLAWWNVKRAAVDIKGGSIDGTAIGQTTPAAGKFTTLTATGNTVLGDTSIDTAKATLLFQPNRIDKNVTIPDGYNALQIGPFSVADSVVVEGLGESTWSGSSGDGVAKSDANESSVFSMDYVAAYVASVIDSLVSDWWSTKETVGSWSAVYIASGQNPLLSVLSTTSYLKTGKLVTCDFSSQVVAVNQQGSGDLFVALPFAAAKESSGVLTRATINTGSTASVSIVTVPGTYTARIGNISSSGDFIPLQANAMQAGTLLGSLAYLTY